MIAHECPQCGAAYEQLDDSCAERFAALLALDHSRQEPWGSRHGSSFCAYMLQHPAGQPRESLERCWTLLYRIWIAGDDPQFVVRTMRLVEQGVPASWMVPPLPADAASPWRLRVTIADLGTFDAAHFPARLEDWCRATLEALGQPSVAT